MVALRRSGELGADRRQEAGRSLTLAAGTPEALSQGDRALPIPRSRRDLDGKAIKNLVAVPGRLVNIVTV